MAYILNGVETGGLPMHLIKPLIEAHEIKYFCETGTAGGQSIMEAAKHFEKCWTIELLNGVADVENFPENVTYLEGDTTKMLPEVVDQLKKLKGMKERQWVIFYLDAHYTDVVPNTSDYPECPLLNEIKTVGDYGEDAIVIIDDARLFFGSPPYPNDPTQWPSISEIFWLLQNFFPFHHITITDDYVLAIPLHLRDTVDKEWRDRFHIRYPNDADKLRQQVKDVYKAFIEKVYKPFKEYIK